MSAQSELITHLETGATTTCRAWAVTRQDGAIYGFTDHDRDLEFDGLTFKADSGLTAGALQQSTGLSVDNTEVVGSLSDAAISETDLLAGRFDGAEVVTWLVNWTDVEQRIMRFRGRFGELRLSGGAFSVELRGLTETLNQPRGRVYQPGCSAVLGDGACRFNLDQATYTIETVIKRVAASGSFLIPSQPGISDRWFEMGRIEITSGPAAGLHAVIKLDQEVEGFRQIDVLGEFDLAPGVGDTVRMQAGCNKLAETCRAKFGNFLNFRGFPHIPGTDWMASFPTSSQVNNGGSRHK